MPPLPTAERKNESSAAQLAICHQGARMHLPAPVSAANGKPCLYWKLPVEIRHMVYKLLYGEAKEIQVITRWTWEDDEKDKDDGRPFPESILSGMLVSKQYLCEAAETLMQNNTFTVLSFSTLGLLLSGKGCPVNRQLLSLITSLRLVSYSSHSSRVVDLKRLRSLEMGIDDRECTMQNGKKTPLDTHADFELVQLPWVQPLLQIRGLHKIKLDVRSSGLLGDDQRLEARRLIVKQVEQLLSDVVTQPRSTRINMQRGGLLDNDLSIPRTKVSKETSLTFQHTKSLGEGHKAIVQTSEIPRNEADFARFMFVHGKALYDWVQDRISSEEAKQDP